MFAFTEYQGGQFYIGGVLVSIVRIKGRGKDASIRVGVEAPKEMKILRSKLVDDLLMACGWTRCNDLEWWHNDTHEKVTTYEAMRRVAEENKLEYTKNG